MRGRVALTFQRYCIGVDYESRALVGVAQLVGHHHVN